MDFLLAMTLPASWQIAVVLAVAVDSLGGLRRYFKSTSLVTGAPVRDSLRGTFSFKGSARGWLDSLDVRGGLTARQLYVNGTYGQAMTGSVAVRSVRGRSTGLVDLRADTVVAGGIAVRRATLQARLMDTGRARFGVAAATNNGGSLALAGDYSAHGDTTDVRLDTLLSDTYVCNFSLVQSMPDSWAIKQLFPVMPIHRLEERPTRHAVLGDITCDSDGKIDQFIDRRDVKRTLRLHQYTNGQPYYMGTFLIGAYQEILGDLHNLFGDTNTVHIDQSATGEVILEAIVKGDTVREVLDYVEFDHSDLTTRLQTAVETAVREGRLDYQEAGRFLKFYEDGLNGYTYLEEPGD